MNSGRASRLAVLPLSALLLLGSFSGCASLSGAGAAPQTSVRLLDTAADFQKLGIDAHEIVAREDGRRSPSDGRHFEWWYFDGLLDEIGRAHV